MRIESHPSLPESSSGVSHQLQDEVQASHRTYEVSHSLVRADLSRYLLTPHFPLDSPRSSCSPRVALCLWALLVLLPLPGASSRPTFLISLKFTSSREPSLTSPAGPGTPVLLHFPLRTTRWQHRAVPELLLRRPDRPNELVRQLPVQRPWVGL